MQRDGDAWIAIRRGVDARLASLSMAWLLGVDKKYRGTVLGAESMESKSRALFCQGQSFVIN